MSIFLILLTVFSQKLDTKAAAYDISRNCDLKTVFIQNPETAFTYMNHSATPTFSYDSHWEKTHLDKALGGPKTPVTRFKDPTMVEWTFQPGIHNYPITATWLNVAKYNGRWVKVVMSLKNMDYKYDEFYPLPQIPVQNPVIDIYDDFWNGTWIFHIAYVDIKYEFYYMDDGSRIDLTGAYVTYASLNGGERYGGGGEGVKSNSLSTVKAWLAKDTLVKNSQGGFIGTSDDFTDYAGGETFYKAAVTLQVPSSALDVTLITGLWSWIKPDFAAMCTTVIKNEKTVDKTKASPGEELSYLIEQPICPVTMYEYDNMKITDTLPAGTSFVSMEATHKNGSSTRTLAQGTDYILSQSGNTVSATFTTKLLDELTYNGDESLFVKIKAKIADTASGTLKNKAVTRVNNTDIETNEVTTEVETFTVTTSKQGEGTIDPTATGLAAGSSKTINYKPADSWYLYSLTVDGQSVNTGTYPSSYTFTDIRKNHTIQAVFRQCYKITTSVVNGSITPTDTNIIPGQSRTITYNPNPGYMLESVTVDDTAVDISKYPSSYAFSDIRQNHKIHVVFRRIPELAITKDVSQPSAKPMENIRYTITAWQAIAGAYTADPVVSDTLPNGMVPDGKPTALLTRANGSQLVISDKISISGNSWSLTVPGGLHTENDGRKDTIRVTVPAKPSGTILGTLKNTAKTKSSETPQVTASADINVVGWAISTHITNGSIDPGVENIKQGEKRTIKYTPNDGYYVKRVSIDGTPVPVETLRGCLSQYTFTNISADHDITVTCAKNPVITLGKQVNAADATSRPAKGELLFPVHVSGTDYLGYSHEYTRILTPDVIQQLHIPAGCWTAREIKCTQWKLRSITPGENCQVNGDSAILDTRDADTASCVFINIRESWKGYGDDDAVANRLKK